MTSTARAFSFSNPVHTTPWICWRKEFGQRAARPLVGVTDVDEVPLSWRAPLAQALAVFQLGEAGEGRIAREIDGVVMAGVDDHYRAALKLFVREEGRHARLLATAVRALGGTLLHDQWTDRLFRRGRRLLGLRLKVLVLLAAEVVGEALYGALAAQLPAGSLRRMLTEIADDERRHLAFHVAFFRAVPVWRPFLKSMWMGLGAAAALTVLWDHRRVLLRCGIALKTARSLAGTVWRVGGLLGAAS